MDRLPKIRVILHGLRSQNDRRHIHGVGVIGIFDIIQRLDQIRMTDGKADAHTGHGTGFTEGLYHQQDRVLCSQFQSGFSAKINICFIYDHHNVLIMTDDILHIL